MKQKKEIQPHKYRQFTVEEETELLTYLLQKFSDKSRTTVKSILSNKQVYINGKISTQFNAPLKPGDELSISMEKNTTEFYHPLLELVYEDADLIVVNKHNGLLAIATANEKEKTAYRILSSYVKKQDSRNHIFVLHRLDRETSGLMIFAKNKRVQQEMQHHWNEVIIERTYVAVIEGKPQKKCARITSNLKENRAMNVYSAQEGKFSATNYNILKSNGKYSLVELQLETGRKNQIRIHMAEIGHPVTGDTKYGATTNPIQRLALHAKQLRFIHPSTRQEMNFQTDIPKKFKLLVKQRKNQ